MYRQGKDEAFARLLNGIRVGDRKVREIVSYSNNSNNNNNVNKEERGLSESLFATNKSTNAHNKTKWTSYEPG